MFTGEIYHISAAEIVRLPGAEVSIKFVIQHGVSDQRDSTNVVRNYLSLIGSEIASRIISFFWVVFMARTLGVSDYGTYSTVLAVIGIVTSFLDFGVTYIVIRENVKDLSLTPRFMGAQIYLRAGLGLLALMAAEIFGHFAHFSPEMKILLLLAGLHMLFQNVGMIGDTFFAVYNKQYLGAILHTIQNLGWAVLGFFALKLKGNLFHLFGAMTLNSFLIFIAYFTVLFSKFGWPSFRVPAAFIWKLLKDATPIGLTGVFANVFQRIDRVILSIYCGVYFVGLYSAAMTLILSVTDLVWSSAIIVLYPYMSSLIREPEKLTTVFRNILIWIFAALWAAALIFIGFSDKIIGLMYGKKFLESSYVLGLLALQLLPHTFHGFFGRLLMVQNKQNKYCLANFAALLTNLAFNLVLIRKWNLIGAAIASILTNIFLIFYYAYFSGSSIRSYVNFRRVGIILCVGLFTLGVARLASSNFFVSLGVFIPLFLALFYWAVDFRREWQKTMELLP